MCNPHFSGNEEGKIQMQWQADATTGPTGGVGIRAPKDKTSLSARRSRTNDVSFTSGMLLDITFTYFLNVFILMSSGDCNTGFQERRCVEGYGERSGVTLVW
jgi:hypothetical protein